MAHGGKMIDGKSLISKQTWDKMHQNGTLAMDANLGKVVYINNI